MIPDVSVILPTYNEAGNIVPLIERIKGNLESKFSFEIVVVDDSSPDGTGDLVSRRFLGDCSVKVSIRKGNRGLAHSIRHGLEMATGSRFVVMDTDFAHDPDEIVKMLHVGEAYDVVIGSRFCAGGNMQDTAHYLASLYYNRAIRVLLRTQVQDNLGGFFTMRRADLESLPWDLIFFGYGDYFFRLIHYAQEVELSIVEVPAVYRERTSGESKSRFFRMIFSYGIQILKLRRRVRRWRRERLTV